MANGKKKATKTKEKDVESEFELQLLRHPAAQPETGTVVQPQAKPQPQAQPPVRIQSSQPRAQLQENPQEKTQEQQAEKLPSDLKDVVEQVVQQAETIEVKSEKIMFLTVLKRFGVAIGGAILLIGVLFALSAVWIFTEVIPLGLDVKMKIIISVLVGLAGLLQVFGGLVLVAG